MPKMPTQKTSDTASTNKNKSNSTAMERESSWAATRRRWLVALAGLVLVALLIASTMYFRGSSETAAPGPANPAEEPSTRSAAPGPWGQLMVTPIVISPPLEYIAADWGRSEGPDEWFFPGTSVEVMEAFLSSLRFVHRGVAKRQPDLAAHEATCRALDLQRRRVLAVCRSRSNPIAGARHRGAAAPCKNAAAATHSAR